MTLRRAFAANLIPAAALWSFAFGILALYRFHVPTQELLASLAATKTAWGLWFVMPAQALAGAVLPFLFQQFQRGDHRKTRLRHVPFLALLFAGFGFATDRFYAFQSQIFGDGADFTTLALKILVDMGIYTPFFVMPIVACAFAFKDCDFSVRRTRELLGRDWYRTRVIPLWQGALIVWVPALVVLYALPLALQFPLQVVVQVFWQLIVVVLTDK